MSLRDFMRQVWPTEHREDTEKSGTAEAAVLLPGDPLVSNKGGACRLAAGSARWGNDFFANRRSKGTAGMNASQRAMAGGVVWMAWAAWHVPGLQHGAWAQVLLLFAAFVLLPLALELMDDRNESGRVVWWVAWTRVGQ